MTGQVNYPREAIVDHPDPSIRVAAIQQAEARLDAETIPFLLRALDDPDWCYVSIPYDVEYHVAAAAVRSLLRLSCREPGFLRRLEQMAWGGPSRDVRIAALAGLLELGLIDLTTAKQRKWTTPESKEEFIQVSGDHRQSVDLLLRILNDTAEPQGVRAEARFQLRRKGLKIRRRWFCSRYELVQ